MINQKLVVVCVALFGVSACGVAEPRDADDSAIEANLGSSSQSLSTFSIGLWPGGTIPYAFAAGLTQAQKDWTTARIAEWEAATANTVDFSFCTVGSTCPSIYLNIRANTGSETGGKCTIGRASGAFCRFDFSDATNALHELGHGIGIMHEHQRSDRDRFLNEGAYTYPNDVDNNVPGDAFLPVLGNYDYDSIMHYASFDGNMGVGGTLRWKDALGNTFSRWVGNQISIHDASRVVQYYARDFEPNWDFFKSLATLPANVDSLPNPYLASGVEAVGTPAVAYTNGVTHVFARGSDNNMYWKTGTSAGAWTSLGCCAGSDPAAVSASTNNVDLLFVGASSGKVIKTHFNGTSWGGWFYITDSLPRDGIRPALVGSGYVGPGVASRGTNLLDVFAVRFDGHLVSISYDGSAWTAWRFHSSGDVTARPAAVALSGSDVHLALTSSTVVRDAAVVFSGSGVSSFSLGSDLGNVVRHSPAAITKRNSSTVPWRVIAVSHSYGWLWHYMANASAGRYIGGIPQSQTGVSAVATGSFSADMVMNGTEQFGCDSNCNPGSPSPSTEIQPGGIWLRRFE